MKNKVLVFLMMFLCFQVTLAQKTYPVTKEVKVEKNGFCWTLYTLNQPPKPLLGVLGMFFEARDVTCDGEKGKLSIVESQNTISIEPIGFSMSLGYAVEK